MFSVVYFLCFLFAILIEFGPSLVVLSQQNQNRTNIMFESEMLLAQYVIWMYDILNRTVDWNKCWYMIFDACSHSCFSFVYCFFAGLYCYSQYLVVCMFLCETFCCFFCIDFALHAQFIHFIFILFIPKQNQVGFQCSIPIKSNYNIYCFISILNHKN